ncbi:MAG: lipid IV(A) 3-deoxy-D-manno-octulosonic acid transferase [Gammaproteobacteria bacterium]
MKHELSTAIYTLLAHLLLPLVLARLAWQGMRQPAYWQRLPERFGFAAVDSSMQGAIWFHAVSVGEANSAVPLVARMREACPELPVLISTMTPTGAECVRHQLDGVAVHRYVPYDLPWAVRGFLRRVRPRILVLMEAELWPNVLRGCARLGVPVVLANARISEKSFRRYQRLSWLTQAMLRNVTVIAAQSTQDAARLIALGVQASRVNVSGNIKFDLELPANLKARAQATRALLGLDRPVWIAASTHAGEEAAVLEAHRLVLTQRAECLLLLAPRHPQRFAEVGALLKEQGFRYVQRSAGKTAAPQDQVFLLDYLGELLEFYAAADLAFVGGSLENVGGHNMLEAAAVGIPVLSGPYVSNFTEISRLLREAGAAQVVQDSSELARSVMMLLSNPPLRQEWGRRGQHVVEQNRGAADCVTSLIKSQICALA